MKINFGLFGTQHFDSVLLLACRRRLDMARLLELSLDVRRQPQLQQELPKTGQPLWTALAVSPTNRQQTHTLRQLPRTTISMSPICLTWLGSRAGGSGRGSKIEFIMIAIKEVRKTRGGTKSAACYMSAL
jgi:hypothetical protein